LAILSGGVGALLVLPPALVYQPLFGKIPPVLIAAAVLLATPILLRDFLTGVVVTLGRPLPFSFSHAAQPLGAVAILVPLAVVWRPDLGTVVMAWGIGILLSGVFAVVIALTLSGGWSTPQGGDLLTLARFGVRTYPALLTRFLNLRFDQLLVALLASTAALGQYVVAVNVAELLFQVPGVILLAVSGSVSALSHEESARLVARMCTWTLLLSTGAAALLAAAAPLAVPAIFGGKYAGAVPSVLLLLPGMVFYAPGVLISEYFIIQRGQAGRAALIPTISLLTSSLLNLALTPAFGARGASMAASVGYAAMFATAVALLRVDTGRPLRQLFQFSGRDLRTVTRYLTKDGR
jgi:O-antigen/teichoic acid export membrane protein